MNFKERVQRRNEFDGSIVYGTKEFNIKSGRDQHMKFREHQDNQWLNRETGYIYEKFAEKRSCPLCGTDHYEVLFVKSGFSHTRCLSCSLVYVNPILTQEEYERDYRDEQSWEHVLENPEQAKIQIKEANYVLDVAQQYLPSHGDIKVCDIGCGPGTLLGEAQRRGWRVMGIDPNKECHPALRKKGIDYLGEFFPLAHPIDRKFDCVFLLASLEHMRDPLYTVSEIKKLLNPKGIVFVSVPNIDALVYRILHEKASTFAGHLHLQCFNNKTLSLLFDKADFDVVEYETVITEIGTIKNYLSYKDPYFADKPEFLDFITPEFIYKNHMARSLNMIGRMMQPKAHYG